MIILFSKKISKFLKITTVLGVIVVTSVGGLKIYNYKFNRNSNNWSGEEKSTVYELGGKDSTYVIGNSIVGGSNLNQYLKGENLKEYVQDMNGIVYTFEDKDGLVYVYEGQDGKIKSITQECLYDENLWNKSKTFWEDLGNKERNFFTFDDLEDNEVDWDNKELEVEYSGYSEKYSYRFRRYMSHEQEYEDGTKSGLEGTVISITIAEIGDDANEDED